MGNKPDIVIERKEDALMKKPISLPPELTRVISHFKRYDIEVPKELLDKRALRPDLRSFPYPLPQRKSEYTCFAEGRGGVMWYGSNSGITRYNPNADCLEDIMMYFSADRDLLDNNIYALLADGDGVWALTEQGVTHIEMKLISGEEKAKILTEETRKYVSRHGMVSQRELSKPRDVKSRVPFGHSDNDGGFTACYAIGEIFRYATLKRDKGDLSPETQKAREAAFYASESTLLMMYLPGRDDGFVARSYVTNQEPLPNDGLFYKKNGKTAVCVNTNAARKRGIVGIEVKADGLIPDRLAKCYREEGFQDTDITYKGDTSSDEITFHYMHLLVAHEFLGSEDAEYNELLCTAAKNTLAHIIDNGYQLIECDGKPTTWAKWNLEYFSTGVGYPDGGLNSVELMMYHRIVMHMTGESGRWQESLDNLISLGYMELPKKHNTRFFQSALSLGLDPREDLMFGDLALCIFSYWGLITLEPEGENKEILKDCLKSWRNKFEVEHNPGYDFPYLLCCPEEEENCNWHLYKKWFERYNISRLASGVSLDKRIDIPKKISMGGYTETSFLLMPDERFISKYDRNPLEFKNQDSGGIHRVESCYPYTFAYWIGRYFGFIEK